MQWQTVVGALKHWLATMVLKKGTPNCPALPTSVMLVAPTIPPPNHSQLSFIVNFSAYKRYTEEPKVRFTLSHGE